MTSRTSRARCHIRFGCVTLALVVTLTHNPRWVVTYLLCVTLALVVTLTHNPRWVVTYLLIG